MRGEKYKKFVGGYLYNYFYRRIFAGGRCVLVCALLYKQGLCHIPLARILHNNATRMPYVCVDIEHYIAHSIRMRVALYVRVSTVEQSIELQKQELTAFATARGWTVTAVYEDSATGTNTKRPGLQAALQAAHRREIDAIVVWKMDRFARSLKDLIDMLSDLKSYGVEFVSLRDNVDMTTSAGKLLMHLIGAFAEFEAAIIRERVSAGVARARSKGVKFGRKPIISHDKVLELHQGGMSQGAIARQLGCSKSAVHKVVKQK